MNKKQKIWTGVAVALVALSGLNHLATSHDAQAAPKPLVQSVAPSKPAPVTSAPKVQPPAPKPAPAATTDAPSKVDMDALVYNARLAQADDKDSYQSTLSLDLYGQALLNLTMRCANSVDDLTSTAVDQSIARNVPIFDVLTGLFDETSVPGSGNHQDCVKLLKEGK